MLKGKLLRQVLDKFLKSPSAQEARVQICMPNGEMFDIKDCKLMENKTERRWPLRFFHLNVPFSTEPKLRPPYAILKINTSLQRARFEANSLLLKTIQAGQCKPPPKAMSAHISNVRPKPEAVLTKIADYATTSAVKSADAYETARYC